MQLGLTSLYQFLDRSQGAVLILATVIETQGASYRKAGAMMLINQHHQSSGLVSGGCLEDDLIQHAAPLFDGHPAKIVHYDLSQEESASMWGLGLGCGGEIRVFLEKIEKATGYGGLNAMRPYWQTGEFAFLQKTITHSDPKRVGEFVVTNNADKLFDSDHIEIIDRSTLATSSTGHSIVIIPSSPQNKLLICGAGPDAIPLALLAQQQFWSVTVVDHRQALLDKKIFGQQARLICCRPNELDLAEQQIDAAVVMTHNVEHDVTYLSRLARLELPYLGLLGPHARKKLLLQKAEVTKDTRIYGPIGLDLGAVLPEEIALSIFAQIQAILRNTNAQFLSQPCYD